MGAVHVMDAGTGRCLQSILPGQHVWRRPDQVAISEGSLYLTDQWEADEDDETEAGGIFGVWETREERDLAARTVFQMSLTGEPRPKLTLDAGMRRGLTGLSAHAGRVYASSYWSGRIFEVELYKHSR